MDSTTTQTPSFDFQTYITNQLPRISAQSATQPTKIIVTPLTGGFTNVTVRATFVPPVILSRGHSKYAGTSVLPSAVLKYAPPFVATDTGQSLSVNRQRVEAQALRIFHHTDADSDESDSIPAIIKWTKAHKDLLRIPGLILHDEEANVLWITDLGAANVLSKWLSNLGSDGNSGSLDDAAEVGRSLGELIGSLWNYTKNPDPEVVEPLKHPRAENLVDLLKGMTKSGLNEVGAPDADELSERVAGSLREGGKVEPCIGMGDFWPESVLIIKPLDSEVNYQCGLIDWEYFGPTSAAADMGMFLGHIHILHLVHAENPSVFGRLRSFSRAFIRACIPHLRSPPSLYFQHKFLLTHGREMVNGYELYAEEWKLGPEFKERMIHLGLIGLRAAGPSGKWATDRYRIDVEGIKIGGGWLWEDLQLVLGLAWSSEQIVLPFD